MNKAVLKVSMKENLETVFLIADCRRELQRLRGTLVQFGDAVETGKAFLTGSFSQAEPAVSEKPGLDLQVWREWAEEARRLAKRTSDLQSKRQLLQVAESYDRFAQ